MNARIAAILALSACVLALGGGIAFAQMDGATPPDGPMQGLLHGQGRFADRFFADYDLNHDGKVTRDEMSKALAARFASVAHGGGMTVEQFAGLHVAQFRQHTAQMFRRLDWNGDGKLSLDEFAGPQRVRFEMMDRDGKGAESCAPVQNAAFRREDRFHRGMGRAHFCAENDLNHDGAVTHAEFDGATAKRFAEETGGAKSMSEDQFAAAALKKYRETSAHFLAKLDADKDGKLSLAEFSGPEMKLFARLDKNRDGAVTRDELSVHGRFHRRG
jgi:Ca2+-binding EF-hand superfamily protein